MQRRKAVTNIVATIGTLFAMPSWATNWKPESLLNSTFFSTDAMATVAEMAETIIPQTDTPGAKSLGVDKLIERIVKDCFDKPTQEQFLKGIDLVNELAQKTNNKSFADSSPQQRLAILMEMSKSENPDQKQFYNKVRQMTIRGYTNSEYFMTNISHFEFAPGRYNGCVKIK
jgi:hypothetical protein